MSKRSHHLPNGSFQNLTDTPQLAKDVSMLSLMRRFLLGRKPPEPKFIPSVKTDLKNYYSKSPTITWFGHSSYLIHFDGVNILVDPVFSGHASPFSFTIKAFNGSDVYKPADMPDIDVMVITHNHYDHLDVETIKALAPTVREIVTPLKGADFLRKIAGSHSTVSELDWWQCKEIGDGLKLTATPARHFSGRGLKRNGSLWASFVLELDGYKIFIGSDSGQETHFKDIGDNFGPFDIALLECGQYNTDWPYIHSFPEELPGQVKDLNAEILMPVHWRKFSLSFHPWDEPIKRLVKAAKDTGVKYACPRIGEPVVLGETRPVEEWWEA